VVVSALPRPEGTGRRGEPTRHVRTQPLASPQGTGGDGDSHGDRDGDGDGDGHGDGAAWPGVTRWRRRLGNGCRGPAGGIRDHRAARGTPGATGLLEGPQGSPLPPRVPTDARGGHHGRGAEPRRSPAIGEDACGKRAGVRPP